MELFSIKCRIEDLERRNKELKTEVEQAKESILYELIDEISKINVEDRRIIDIFNSKFEDLRKKRLENQNALGII